MGALRANLQGLAAVPRTALALSPLGPTKPHVTPSAG
jgi:hypothetical protein